MCLRIGPANGVVARAAVHDVAADDDALSGRVVILLGVIHERHQLVFPVNLGEGVRVRRVRDDVRVERMMEEKVALCGVVELVQREADLPQVGQAVRLIRGLASLLHRRGH